MLPAVDPLETNLVRLQARLPDAPVAGILLTRIIMQLGRDLGAMLEHQIRPFGLTEAEFRALASLYSQPDGVAHPGDLCACAAQRPANMSRICDALVERGLITREASAQDRRRMVLRITESGEALVRQLLPAMWGPLRTLLEELTEQDLRHLGAQLKRLGAKLEAALAEEGSAERSP